MDQDTWLAGSYRYEERCGEYAIKVDGATVAYADDEPTAALFCAAPLMYAALELVLVQAQDGVLTLDGDTSDILCAALAKARGEAA